MSDGQTLYLVLVLLYLADCLVWVGRRSVLFSASWLRGWRFRYANDISGNAQGSLSLLNPLPPFGVAVAGRWSPVSLSPDGVCDLTLNAIGSARPAQSGLWLRYDQLNAEGTDGKYLLLNGIRFAKCETEEQADTLARAIRTLKQESASARERRLRESVAAAFSRDDARARLGRLSDVLRGIRVTTVMFFVFLYILVPIVVTYRGLDWLVIPVAAAMVLWASIIAGLYLRAHRRLWPARRGERFSNAVKMVLCPPAAIRAGDLLSLEAMACFHPVATGDALLAAGGAEFFGPIVRDLRYPLRLGQPDREAVDIASWRARIEGQAIEALLRRRGGEQALACYLSAPDWDGASATFCPRCRGQFVLTAGECPDCPGVSLETFDARSAGVEVKNG